MLEVLDHEGNVLSFKATGRLTHQDYQEVLIPKLEQIIEKYQRARVLFEMGAEFHGWEPAAMWDDATFGIKHRNDFEKCAVVGGPSWVEWAAKLGATLISGEVKTFEEGQLDEAKSWISS